MSTCLKTFSLEVANGNGPSFWFKLDEASGDRVDSIQGAVLVPTFTTGSAAGKILGAAVDGPLMTQLTTAYFVGTDPKLANVGTGFDFFGWIMIEESDLATDTMQVNYLKSDGIANIFSLQLNPFDSQVDCLVSGDVGSEYISVPYVFSLGTWIFYRVFFDVATGRFGLQVNNGAIAYSGIYTLAAEATATLYLSAFSRFGGTFPPYLTLRFDETGMFTTKLTEAEATAIWNGGAGSTFP